jgi:two-component system cell cycle sensor histidine kinase/response regulator CckA
MSHGETLLVVEDEEGVRELVRRVLTRHGYEVLEARHGRDALVEAERHEKIDLLLTDVVMPEMSGVALAAALRRRRPDLRVLYMSGYTEDEIVRRGDVGEGGLPLLQKPFTGDQLARLVRQSLDAAANAPAGPGSAGNPP